MSQSLFWTKLVQKLTQTTAVRVLECGEYYLEREPVTSLGSL